MDQLVTPEIARITLAFLSRADLKGAEMPQFLKIVRVLEIIANENGLPAPITPQTVAQP